MIKQPRATEEFDLAWFTDHAKRQTSNSRGTNLPRETRQCSYAGKIRPFTAFFENSGFREMRECDFAMIKQPRETEELDLAWFTDPAKQKSLIWRGSPTPRNGSVRFGVVHQPREIRGCDLAWTGNNSYSGARAFRLRKSRARAEVNNRGFAHN